MDYHISANYVNADDSLLITLFTVTVGGRNHVKTTE